MNNLALLPADPPKGLVANAAMMTGAVDAPSLYEALDRLDLKGSLKLAAVGIAGMTMFKGRKMAGELQASAANLETMRRQRDEAVERAAWLEELLLRQQAAAGPLLAGVAPVVATLPEGARKAAKPRWTAAERDLLLELRAGGMSYAKIATALGTGRSAAAVGAKARALGRGVRREKDQRVSG